MSRISVIVPVYNTEKYLHRCVDSILAQTFTDFELLLINDGSSDNSGAICDEYAEKDSRVRVFHKENGGVSSARNLGLDNARGEWITFVDSDDTLPVNALEDIYRNDSEDLIVSAFYRINSKIKTDIEWKCGTIFKDDFNNFLSLNLNNTLFRTPWAKMYRTELIHLNKIRMDESLSFGEDTVFVTEYISHCNSMRVIDTICYNYYDIGEDYINKYKDYNDSIYDYCYKIREKYALLDEKFGLRGCRIVYGFIFDILKLNIDEGRGDIKKFRELLLLKEVQDTLNERNSLYIKMMLFSAKSLYLLKVYLWIIRLIKQYV